MSGVCGIFNLDGAPIEAQDLQRMTAALAYRGPDGIAQTVQGEFGLAHLLAITTPEARFERQPLVFEPPGWLLAADARLDNRPELIAALGDAPLSRQAIDDHRTLTGSIPITDAELILAAYRRWGEDCPQHLIGDFAFAVYRPAERRLFLARDPQGMRQMVYTHTGGRFRFATGAAALLALQPEQRLNRELLQDVIAGLFDRYPDQTPYRDIQRLPPAHCLTVDPAGVRLRPYWRLGDGPAPGRLGEAELAEALAELLERVMRAHLRAAGGVTISAGGGLDSSGLAALADRLHPQTTAPVQVISQVYPATPGAGDEVHRRILQQACPNLAFSSIDFDDRWFFRPTPIEPDLPYEDLDVLIGERSGLFSMFEAVRASGGKALIYGYMGDQVFGEWLYHRTPCLGDFPPGDWPAELPYFRQADGASTLSVAAYAMAGRILGAEPRKRLWRMAGRLRPTPALTRHAWAHAAAPVPAFLPPRRGLSAAANYLYNLTVNGGVYARLRTMDQVGAWMGVEMRFPYLDRRLVDFMAALDGPYFARRGETRRLYRLAMAGRMPEAIRTRRSKEQIPFLLERGLAQHEKPRLQALLDHPLAARLGLLDAEAYRRAWAGYWNGAHRKYAPLALAVCVELWLQRLVGDGRLAPATDCKSPEIRIKIKGD